MLRTLLRRPSFGCRHPSTAVNRTSGSCTIAATFAETFPAANHEGLPESAGPLLCGERLIDDISLHDALNSLSQQDRDMVLLRYVNGEPIGVISEITGMSRFAVSRRLKKVLGMLRKELEKEAVT